MSGPTVATGQGTSAEAEFPTALGNHLDALKQAVPGNGGMAEEGPAGAAEFEFLQRAYPADSISLAAMEAARASFTATVSRGFPRGNRHGQWTSIGPSKAIYPFTEFRNSSLYVPNEYV
ncbi:MAG: exo-alpha-sialidase, partial [Gaiellaceae bacterium]